MKLLSSKRFWIALILLLILSGVAYGVYAWFTKADPAQRYRMQAVESGDVAQNVSANGTLNPVSLISIGTQVSGTVKKLNVDFNSKVKEGQILAELDDTLLAAQAHQDEANLKNARASLELAQANERRMQSLFAQDYVSRQDYDTAVQARKSAAASVEQQQAAVAKSRANISYSVIRSPVGGTVVDRQVDVGQTVAASFQTPTLFKIARDLTQMQIDSSFAEADIGQIKEGQQVRFNVDAFQNRTFHGVVKQVRLNPTTQSNVVTYDVVVSVENPDQVLLPGMTAYVNINVARRQNVVLVPNAALRFKPLDGAAPSAKPAGAPGMAAAPGGAGGQSAAGQPGAARGEGGQQRRRDPSSGTVWVLEGDKLKSVAIKTGITDGRNTEVLEGDLKPGQQVVVAESSNGKTKASSGTGPQFRPF
ncbi:MAG TPA: efflux RND transporter periplasmic adaptor subunit [Rhodocyclaceae bacterium]|nr:efflux RND transporter periplasmic adaptor subunit [Rhodocyclaceae bacterium]